MLSFCPRHVGQQFWPVPIVFHNLQIDSSYLDPVRISKSGTIFYLLRSVGQQLDYLWETASNRLLNKPTVLTRPTPTRRDAPFRRQGRSR
jgi:hypothetical protein